MVINYEKRFKEIMRNPTALQPCEHFPGLGLPNSEFISVNDFLDTSRQETIKKLYALREISNLLLGKDDTIGSVAYHETVRPELVLLFKDTANEKYHIREKIYLTDKNVIIDPKKKKVDEHGYKIEAKELNGYTINEDTLNHLLHEDNRGTSLEDYLKDTHKDSLKLFREYLDTCVFYADLQLVDTTGCVNIQTHHDNYLADGINDSFFIPENFGKVTLDYDSLTIFNRIKAYYDPRDERIDGVINFLNSDELGKRLYIHKAFLPKGYLEEKK